MKYPTVRDYVARRRAEIALEAGKPLVEAMVPQSHEPGAEAEVDFAELYVDLEGQGKACGIASTAIPLPGWGRHT